MISLAATLGVPRVVVDSSGNAGKAVAAYGAQAGLATEVYVPEGTDADQVVASIRSYGAAVVAGAEGAPGDGPGRAGEVGEGELSLVRRSHVYQPAFHHGRKTLAYEIYEQLAPTRAATVVVPAGNGTLVLGLWLGFRDLQAAGRLDSVPRIVAVQAERCAPLAGLARSGPTMATGIDVSGPPRAGQVRAAVLASKGWVATVTETEIARGQNALADLGIEVEPTGGGRLGRVGWRRRRDRVFEVGAATGGRGRRVAGDRSLANPGRGRGGPWPWPKGPDRRSRPTAPVAGRPGSPVSRGGPESGRSPERRWG